MHGYLENEETLGEYERIEEYRLKRNMLSQCKSGCIKLDYVSRIHHAQVTVVRELFEEHPYTGAKENDLKDDCVFCYRIFSIPGIKSVYIDHALSKYVQSFSCIAYTEGKE